MSYADVVIERNSATVDDEYQQMLLHKSYTYGFTMMMWANYVLATVLIWLIPEPKMVGVTVAIILMPLVGLLFSQRWLRRQVSMPKINGLTKGEIAALVAVIGLWLIGFIRVQMLSEASAGGALSESWGSIAGAVVGAAIGLAFVYFLFKVVWPVARNRDQRRLDRELDDEFDGESLGEQR